MVALLAGAACWPPDSRPAPPEALADAALEMLAPDTVRTVLVEPGVVYRYLWSPRGPWAVHVVQAELGERCDLELAVLRAADREAGGRGRERVSSMVERASRPVVVAVNADFFTAEGAALGTEATAGSLTSAAERPVVSWRLGRAPWIGVADVAADSVHVGWSVPRAIGDGVTEAVGGFPELLDRGRVVGDLEVAARPAFAAERHPRTAIAYEETDRTLWIIVVDGRQRPYSDGMTLPELTDLLRALGADEALNLDGGGSSVLVLGDSTVSRPSDLTGERPVVNALALVRDERGCSLNAPR